MKKYLLTFLIIFCLCLTGCNQLVKEEATEIANQDLNYAIIYSPDGNVIKKGYILDFLRINDCNINIYFEDGRYNCHPLWVYFEHREVK